MTEATQADQAPEPVFVKFTGPMATLTQGKMKFIKDRIYKVLDPEKALDMIETGRFQQTRDPSKPAPARRGVRIRQERQEPKAERGDLSPADLRNGGEKNPRPSAAGPVEGIEGEVETVKTAEDGYPRLPSQPFTSKVEAVKWARENIGVELDKSRSITELNRRVIEEHGKKYGAQQAAEDIDDDTRDENTKVEAVTVA